MCGLRLMLVLSFAPRGFSPGTPIFLSPQKPAFPYSISTSNQVDEGPISGGATSKSLFDIIIFLNVSDKKYQSDSFRQFNMREVWTPWHLTADASQSRKYWFIYCMQRTKHCSRILPGLDNKGHKILLRELEFFFLIPYFSPTICHHLNVYVHFMTKADFYSEQVVPSL